MADKEQIDQLIKKLSERMGTPESEIKSAVQNSNYSKLLDKMNPDQAAQINRMLSDEQAAKQFLSSPQAKAIIKRLMG
ncbi:MAG: hypothetical protein IJ639_04505 [Ruminococcus sp.]|nr:hypothetical protein [Ruminococcus sp.]